MTPLSKLAGNTADAAGVKLNNSQRKSHSISDRACTGYISKQGQRVELIGYYKIVDDPRCSSLDVSRGKSCPSPETTPLFGSTSFSVTPSVEIRGVDISCSIQF
ncbi:hypothetical protein EVAR_39299_1 [Eumeta japonica]|uniref:Uncharacterized protein n=1 Tax=Eumeta variegata TaxID=151549 RepID=A0A4C1VWP4_EUMVA|nr:hypothetical protein EVAR_39299_1 [Eumeta japonica]